MLNANTNQSIRELKILLYKPLNRSVLRKHDPLSEFQTPVFHNFYKTCTICMFAKYSTWVLLNIMGTGPVLIHRDMLTGIMPVSKCVNGSLQKSVFLVSILTVHISVIASDRLQFGSGTFLNAHFKLIRVWILPLWRAGQKPMEGRSHHRSATRCATQRFDDNLYQPWCQNLFFSSDIIKSPRSGVTLCFQFVSAASAVSAASTSATAKTFPSRQNRLS